MNTIQRKLQRQKQAVSYLVCLVCAIILVFAFNPVQSGAETQRPKGQSGQCPPVDAAPSSLLLSIVRFGAEIGGRRAIHPQASRPYVPTSPELYTRFGDTVTNDLELEYRKIHTHFARFVHEIQWRSSVRGEGSKWRSVVRVLRPIVPCAVVASQQSVPPVCASAVQRPRRLVFPCHRITTSLVGVAAASFCSFREQFRS